MSESGNVSTYPCAANIEFRLPRSGIGLVYRDTTPWLRIDGKEHQVDGWQACRVSLTPGKHRIEVGVPHRIFGTVGHAGRNVRLAPGDEVSLTYQAPSSPGGIGEVLFPSELSDSNAAWAPVVISVAILVVVLCVAYGFF